MSAIFLILAVIALIAGLVCSVIILIDAFRNELWMGILSILCGFYFLYYAIFEFEHENKWLLVLGSLGGSSIAAGFYRLSTGLPI